MSKDVYYGIYVVLLFLPVIPGLLLWKKKGILSITFYLLCGAVTELIVEFCLPPRTYNHFVYAACMLAGAGAVLYYFSFILRSTVAYIIYIFIFLFMMLMYIKHNMWLTDTVIPVKYIAGYYSMLIAATLLFIWQVIIRECYKQPFKPLWFAAVFMVYFTLALLNNSLEYSYFLDPPDKFYFKYAFEAIVLGLHMVIAFLLSRLLFVRHGH